jgi:hypothetical protein
MNVSSRIDFITNANIIYNLRHQNDASLTKVNTMTPKKDLTKQTLRNETPMHQCELGVVHMDENKSMTLVKLNGNLILSIY